MKTGIVVFPGTNCDHDCYYVIKHVLKKPVEFIWFKDEINWSDYAMVLLPGGFSYGDYLRPAAIAQYSTALKGIHDYAKKGGLILGICNGFQILLEMGLLPGAMIKNSGLKFICKDVSLLVENNETPYTMQYEKKQVISLPIAHGEGHYYIDDKSLPTLFKDNQIVLRYCDEEGRVNKSTNPNGSRKGIAGLSNKEGNILGLMPHPERASEEIMGGIDGYIMFESVYRYLEQRK